MKFKNLNFLKTFFTLFASISTLTLFYYCGSSNDEESGLNVNEVSTQNSNDESNNVNSENTNSNNSNGDTNSNISEVTPSKEIYQGRWNGSKKSIKSG